MMDNITSDDEDLGEIARLFKGTDATSSASQELLRMLKDLAPLKAFNDPRGIYARLPYGWEID